MQMQLCSVNLEDLHLGLASRERGFLKICMEDQKRRLGKTSASFAAQSGKQQKKISIWITALLGSVQLHIVICTPSVKLFGMAGVERQRSSGCLCGTQNISGRGGTLQNIYPATSPGFRRTEVIPFRPAPCKQTGEARPRDAAHLFPLPPVQLYPKGKKKKKSHFQGNKPFD